LCIPHRVQRGDTAKRKQYRLGREKLIAPPVLERKLPVANLSRGSFLFYEKESCLFYVVFYVVFMLIIRVRHITIKNIKIQRQLLNAN